MSRMSGKNCSKGLAAGLGGIPGGTLRGNGGQGQWLPREEVIQSNEEQFLVILLRSCDLFAQVSECFFPT